MIHITSKPWRDGVMTLKLLYCLIVFAGAILAVLISHRPVQALDPIRIAVSNPNMPNLTVAVAQKQGFFRNENIEAEIIRMNPNVAITALASGDVDYCQLFGAVVSGAIAGLPVRIVAGFWIIGP